MRDFKDKVAVVTGAASGIGLAMAKRFAMEGMKVVLSDIEEAALAEAERGMAADGHRVLAVRTDVAQAAAVEELAQRALQTFGAVHIVCNNAGVAAPVGPIWKRTIADWEWVLGVNLWGVIHGIRVFTPIMLSQKTEGHIVNTASIAGLLSNPFMGIYNASKHAVVAISETMHGELAAAGVPVKVSVLCPGFVKTRIGESERNRVDAESGGAQNLSAGAQQAVERIRALLAAGLPPEQIADRVLAAIRDEQLYILTHPEYLEALRTHMEDVTLQRNPDLSGLL